MILRAFVFCVSSLGMLLGFCFGFVCLFGGFGVYYPAKIKEQTELQKIIPPTLGVTG